MKSLIPSVLSCLSLLGAASAATPTAPGLTYLYTANITGGDYYNVGLGPRGQRVVVPILRGTFSGPRLNGTVLPLGGDWTLVDGNGTYTADVRQTFKTSDGDLIQIFETGTSQPDGTLHVRLTFETGSAKYAWINGVIGVGILHILNATDLSIDAWQLTSPK